jgi:hypothetical protein
MICTRHQAARWMRLGIGLMVFAAAGCALMGAGRTRPKLGLIAVAPGGTGFVEQGTGRAFVPFGTNYYDPNTGWAPKIWQQFDPNRVTNHFKVMSDLGVNGARVFLAAATFQPDVNTVSEEALAKLDTLVQIARQSGIRLVLTGPDHWEGRPPYWKPDRFAGAQALQALDNFWRVVGQRYQGEPAILAWDLLNEPHMPWFVETWRPKWNAWLHAKYTSRDGLEAAWGSELREDESWDNVGVPADEARKGNPRLLDWQLFRETLADEWVRRQAAVLRQADPTHLITVGYIQWSYPVVRPGNPSLYSAFNPHRQAQWLDFVSVHFYPLMGQPLVSKAVWDENLAYLQSILAYCQTGKPVVLEEYGWYGGGAPQGRQYLNENEQARWLVAEIEASRRLAGGWLSWPFADTPDSTDMSLYGGLVKTNMIYKLWGRSFRVYASQLAILPQPAPQLPAFDFAASLTAPVEELLGLQEKYGQMVQAAVKKAGPLPQVKEEQQAPSGKTEVRIL